MVRHLLLYPSNIRSKNSCKDTEWVKGLKTYIYNLFKKKSNLRELVINKLYSNNSISKDL